MYDYDTNEYGYGAEGHPTRNLALAAVVGLAAYGIYRLFANPDMVRRFGPMGDRVADGVQDVKHRASTAAHGARDKANELAGRAKEKYQNWRQGAATGGEEVGSGVGSSGLNSGSGIGESV
ncbi:MAG TPA: hypothetical protein VEL07_04715 [Planctomycetota bacterium]|nr:hypothetical protein [Planctomycetota bacterium]